MGRVALTVNGLDSVCDFYGRGVGLQLRRRNGETAELRAGNDILLEMRRNASARRRSPRQAGLFHTTFLLPTREGSLSSRPTSDGWTQRFCFTRQHLVMSAGAFDFALYYFPFGWNE
jgi:catechol 2,3-dioxygenase